MLQGEAKANLDKAMEIYIHDKAERLFKKYVASLTVDGQPVSLDDTEVEIDHDNKSINFNIKTPLYYTETGKTGFVKFEMPRRMAV